MVGLASGFGYALYSIFSTYALKKYHSITITFYTFVLAALGTLPLSHVPELMPMLSNPQVLLYGAGLIKTPFSTTCVPLFSSFINIKCFFAYFLLTLRFLPGELHIQNHNTSQNQYDSTQFPQRHALVE